MSDKFLFDPEGEEGSHFDLIPAGDYEAEIIAAEIAQPRSGDGLMLKLTWRITKGDYEGRLALQPANSDHRTPDAEGSLHRLRHQ